CDRALPDPGRIYHAYATGTCRHQKGFFAFGVVSGFRPYRGLMPLFDWPVRVYYEDTDSGGVVYHANYLKFMERARTEWLRKCGFEQNNLKDEHNCLFAVHSMQIHYRYPARFNDALLIRSEITQMSGASMQFEQSALRDGELLCT